MWLYFDSTGALIEALQHGPAARAGTTDYQIFAYFEGVDTIANGSATVKLVKPDLYDSSYPPLGMNKVSMKFKKLNGENSEHFSVNGGPNGDGTYPGFLFDFSNFSGDQDVAILLDTPGLWRAIISLYGQNHVSVQGTATFNVQYGSVIDEGTELAWEEIVNSIFRIINTKLNIVNGIPVASSTESIDLTEYEVGQVFYIINAGKTTNKLVRVIENQSEEKDFDTLFDFTAYYTKDEIDAKVLELNGAISEEARLRSAADDALSDRINQKQDKLVRDELPTAQLQYAVGFDSQGNLRKGAGGGGAIYNAGPGINITDFTISADTTVLATKLDLNNYATTSEVSAISGRVTTIEGLIPAQASSSNQLADKNFVNSSIATNTAYFIGTFGSVEELARIGVLAVNSILKAGSVLKAGSMVNYDYVLEDVTLTDDITVAGTNSSLAFGSVIKLGSTIYTGSWINHIYYDSSVVTDADITIETLTNNDYANVTNSARDFASTTEMNAFSKALLTNYDYAWVVNGTKYDLYRFDIETQIWTLQETNIAKTDVSLPTVYNRYTYNGNTNVWTWNYSVNTSGFTADQWAAINSGITNEILSGLARENELADAYSSSATYAVGDYCIYNNTLYRCTTAVTSAESFDSNKWTAVKIADVMVDLYSNQTVLGQKNMSQGCYFGTDARIYQDGQSIKFNKRIQIALIFPTANKIDDLGNGGLGWYWRDIWFSRNIVTLDENNNQINIPANKLATTDQAFNVINAPASTTLTQAEYDIITNGKITRVIGSFFSYPYVILYPPTDKNGSDARLVGKCLVQSNGQSWQETNYIIVKSTKVISISTSIGFNCETDETRIAGLKRINGLGIEYYKNNVYPYASNSTTTLQYETINNISISANTTYTLATAPANTYPEYKAKITNTDTTNAITITLPSGTAIKAEPTIVVSSNTFVIPADTTVIVNIQDDLALVMLK